MIANTTIPINPERRVLSFQFREQRVRVLLAEDHPQLLASDVIRALSLRSQNGFIANHFVDLHPDQLRYEPRNTFFRNSGRPVPTVLLSAILKLAWRARHDIENAIDFVEWCSQELIPGIRQTIFPHANGTNGSL
jgi:prophage antirepressor-like protein